MIVRSPLLLLRRRSQSTRSTRFARAAATATAANSRSSKLVTPSFTPVRVPIQSGRGYRISSPGPPSSPVSSRFIRDEATPPLHPARRQQPQRRIKTTELLPSQEPQSRLLSGRIARSGSNHRTRSTTSRSFILPSLAVCNPRRY